jgi:hypothetical protein
MKPKNHEELVWHKIDIDNPTTFPEVETYVLLSFENFSMLCVGQCIGNDEEGYKFIQGDDDEYPLSRYGLFVNAWMPLPERM